MTSVLDYSKWDNLEVSDDEDEVRRPTVHKLDKPTSVTFGGSSSTFKKTIKKTTPTFQDVTDDTDQNQKQDQNKTSLPPSSSLLLQQRTKNGAATDGHMWSQTRSDITIRIHVPSSVRAKDIVITVPDEKTLLIKMNNEPFIQDQKFSFPVLPVPDTLDVDWEIERDANTEDGDGISQTLLRVTLQKKTITSQVIMWWNRIWESEDIQIDVTSIEARRSKGGVEKMKNAADVWAEAHKMFRDKVKARKAQGPEEVEVE